MSEFTMTLGDRPSARPRWRERVVDRETNDVSTFARSNGEEYVQTGAAKWISVEIGSART
ncbi:hypothetical protein L842_3249 [Mycobacterium intracellulare MIN_052511_1280]|nr:hypothetical protein L842_3249 [Mycobacterium intracellulare MIN_052511_1280]